MVRKVRFGWDEGMQVPDMTVSEPDVHDLIDDKLLSRRKQVKRRPLSGRTVRSARRSQNRDAGASTR